MGEKMFFVCLFVCFLFFCKFHVLSCSETYGNYFFLLFSDFFVIFNKCIPIGRYEFEIENVIM